jgi:tetratricopeptide (TPR) repeat protein
LIEAGDQYVTLITDLLRTNPEVKVKHPERGDLIPEISFVSAQTFYKHGQFKEAIKRLEQLFEYDPTHKYAAYAVNTMLDCYVRLRYWDEIEQWATRLIDARNFKIKSKRDLNKIRAVARGEKARDRAAVKDYKGAIADYMSVFKEFRKDDPSIAANALHAVGVIYQAARRLPDAIKTYQTVATTFPNNDRAPEAMNEIGLIYESQTQFKKAATALEALVKKFPNYPTAPDALRNAGLIREAIGDTKGAIKAFAAYVKKFKGQPDISSVDHRIGKILFEAGGKKNLIKSAKHFKAFAKREAKKGEGANADLIIEALTRAGLITKDLGNQEKRKSKRKAMLKSAKSSFTASVTAFSTIPSPSPMAQHFAAEAAFELVEFQYETFKAAELDMKNMKRLAKSIGVKADLMTSTEANYFKILEYKDSQVSAGALFRIGKLYLDFAETLLNAPIPENIPYEWQDEYVAALEEKAFPIKEKSLGAFLNALRTAQDLKAYNRWSKKSAEFASKLNPDEFPVTEEKAANPNHFKNTLASNNLIRSLRRGNIIVPMIELEDEKQESPAN